MTHSCFPGGSPTRREILFAAGLAGASLPLAGIISRADAAPEEAEKGGPTLLIPATAPDAQPADPWHNLKAGVASYSFRKLPLEGAIKGINRVGLKYVSIKDAHCPLQSTAEQRKEVAQKFKNAGIEPLSCGNISLDSNEAKSRNAFEYARDLGVRVMVCAPEAGALPMLEKLVKEYDIRMAIHNHGPEDKRFPSPNEVWDAVKDLDERVGLCIDVGHTARAHVDPVEAILKYKSRLYDLHMKDVTRTDRRGTADEVEVGRGVLDKRGMLKALVEIKYAYHVGFEHEKNAEDPLPGLAESVGYLKAALDCVAR